MNEDMIKNLGNMLKNGNIPDDIKNMLANFSKSENSSGASSPSPNSDFDSLFESIKNCSSTGKEKTNCETSNPFANIDISTMMKMKSIMDKLNNNTNNPRSNLLLSLKPYLKPSRKEKVDQYIKIFSMTQIFDTLNTNGGENVK